MLRNFTTTNEILNCGYHGVCNYHNYVYKLDLNLKVLTPS